MTRWRTRGRRLQTCCTVPPMRRRGLCCRIRRSWLATVRATPRQRSILSPQTSGSVAATLPPIWWKPVPLRSGRRLRFPTAASSRSGRPAKLRSTPCRPSPARRGAGPAGRRFRWCRESNSGRRTRRDACFRTVLCCAPSDRWMASGATISVPPISTNSIQPRTRWPRPQTRQPMAGHPMWKPNITSVPTSLRRGFTYTLYGRQINGLSQAVSYGDDATMATNYPIVQIRDNTTGHVFYCRTFNHSTMAVNTGTVIHHTQFTVPAGAELGGSTITVIANGIASNPVAVSVVQIKLKEIKEIKIEKIEAKELEAATGGEPSGQTDANLQAVVRMLAERADQAEIEKEQQGAFIQPEERPEVGSAAIGTLPPPSKAKSVG